MKYYVALVSSALIATAALADGRADYYQQLAHQRYFDSLQNARTFGMGGSSMPTSQDSSSITTNPAGLGLMQDAEVSASYGRDYISGNDITDFGDVQQDFDHGHALAAMPLAPQYDALPLYGN